jgi:hypothetical protein
MTLNYNGQEIDICAIDDTKIISKDNKDWITLSSDLNNCNYIKYLGINLPVIPKKDLIHYKKQLNGNHQLSIS